MSKETERAKELTKAHWEGYIKPLLTIHGMEEHDVEIVGFHYVSSGVHFYLHAVEDCRNSALTTSRAAFANASGVAAPVAEANSCLCNTCDRDSLCGGEWPAVDGSCSGYIATVVARELDLSLPTITIDCSLHDIAKKYGEEYEEWQAERGSGTYAEMIEAWDIIQVRATFREHGGDDTAVFSSEIFHAMRTYHKEEPKELELARRATLIKNAARSYYAPPVCARIIETAGKEWRP